jgi:3-isopropylmalate/(R)-2-methylmalate dehydratase small subunit
MSAERIDVVEGRALPMRGEDIDTDRIMPARFLKSITFDGLEAHLFEDDRLAATRAGQVHPFDESRYQGASILLVNRNFGSGSSREHAPQGLRRSGIRAVIGESFAEIFFGNSLMIGLACVTARPADIDALMALVDRDPRTVLRLDVEAGSCTAGGLTVAVSAPSHVRDALLTGAWDTTGLLTAQYDEVNAVASRLPYLSGFSSPRQT